MTGSHFAEVGAHTALEDPVLVACLILGLVTAVVLVTMIVVSAQQRGRVKEASIALMHLGKLNEGYEGSVRKSAPIRATYSVTANTKSKFDRFDLVRYLSECVVESESWFEHEIRMRLQALAHFDEYHRHYEGLATQFLGASSDPRVKPERFRKIESKIYNRMKLGYPEAHASVTATLRYTSPKGQNSYVRHATWTFDQLRNGIRSAQQLRERQSTTQAQRARERALMTPALRSDVLRRDGYRCRMCGASSNDGVRLHIDHIIPVSHDGPSRLENLQTLCDTCNLGKGNRFVG